MSNQGRFDRNPPNSAASMEARRREFLNEVKNRASKAMETGLDLDAPESELSKAVGKVHAMTTDNMAIIERNAAARRRQGQMLPQVACKMGCDFCCFLRVKASVPEVLNIADHVRANFSDEETSQLMARIQENITGFAGLDARQQINKMLPCPLLVDHICSIHPIRPIPCRSHHSVDVEACKRGLVHPESVQIPHFVEVESVVAPIVEGIAAAIKVKGLKDDGVVLSRALSIALTEPDARQRWLAGENVFAPAVDHELNRLSATEAKSRRPKPV